MFARPMTAITLATTLLAAGCSTPKGENADEKRDYVRAAASETLKKLYQERPDLEPRIEKAAGYGVFSTIGTNLILVSTGGGFGVVYNNDTKEETFMRMGEVGVGLGLGVKDFRAVFVFDTAKAVTDFVETGWAFGADADAAAKTGDTGGAAGAKGDISDEVTIYQLTENGLALSATVAGTKYWKDDDLN
ncbi:MAG: YSC84-related protein [Planctomycetota bacterium]